MKNSSLTIRISEDNKARLKEVASNKGMSVADLVVKSVELLDQIDTEQIKRYGLSGEKIADMLALLYK